MGWLIALGILAVLAVIGAGIGWNAYQAYQDSVPEYTQISYPEEALLLRTLEGQHMLAQVGATGRCIV